MISDLRADSVRWRQEQRQTGTRGSNSPIIVNISGFTVPDSILEPYVGSRTYQASSATSAAQRRDGDSPQLDQYGVPQQRGGRNQVDSMQIDPPQPARGDPRYGQQPQSSRGYPPENGGYPPASRDRYADQGGRPPYQQDQPMQDAYARAPVTASYGNDPRYAPAGYPDQNPGAPQSYYMPVTAGYPNAPVMAPGGQDPRQYPPQPFGQQPQPTGRDPRDNRDPRAPRDPRDPRDPRFAGQSGYDDPRYAYPSPAATVSSVAPGRDPIANPQQPGYAYIQR